MPLTQEVARRFKMDNLISMRQIMPATKAHVVSHYENIHKKTDFQSRFLFVSTEFFSREEWFANDDRPEHYIKQIEHLAREITV